MELIQKIDAAQYLYLRLIGEPEDNVLQLEIEEAEASGEPKDIEICSVTISGTREISSNEKMLCYQIIFKDYIAYSVTNESYASLDATEIRTGRLFCVYSKSHFLDYVRAATFATDDFPGPFTHYEINCLNHVIDLVSVTAPEIKVIDRV